MIGGILYHYNDPDLCILCVKGHIFFIFKVFYDGQQQVGLSSPYIGPVNSGFRLCIRIPINIAGVMKQQAKGDL